MYYHVPAISVDKLRSLAYIIREHFELLEELVFPICRILDYIINEPKNFDSLELIVLNDDNEILDDEEMAKYDYTNNVIYIKETEFNDACNGVGRARFTLTHELSHFFLMKIQKIEPIQKYTKPEKSYNDADWQANNLAAELLIPYNETKDFSIEEIVETCQVSEECATYWKYKKNIRKIIKI